MTTWNVQTVMTWSMNYLKERGFENPRLDVETLLSYALQVNRIQLYIAYDRPMSIEERDCFRSLLKERGQGVPVAYLVGLREFMGLDFRVSPEVLIPRPDTETLVELLLERVEDKEIKVLDIGVGSGCVGLSLLHLKQKWQLTGWDVSAAALKIATENAEKHQVSDRVTYLNMSALERANWAAGSWDVIVSNPPYIANDEFQDLCDDVRQYEPHEALFADNDGLRFYQIYADCAFDALRDNGILAVEIGWKQAERVQTLLKKQGWSKIEVIPDLAGRDRVICATKGLGFHAEKS
ncbi:MAG: peptide chain release factor N(5)-glutamine methyltransferase [Oligoflexales bacterium]